MSKISNYCEIDIKSKESYSGMQTNAELPVNSKYSDDISSLNNTFQCISSNTVTDNSIKFSTASNYKPRWEMVLEQNNK
jgi:hypothetical protein